MRLVLFFFWFFLFSECATLVSSFYLRGISEALKTILFGKSELVFHPRLKYHHLA